MPPPEDSQVPPGPTGPPRTPDTTPLGQRVPPRSLCASPGPIVPQHLAERVEEAVEDGREHQLGDNGVTRWHCQMGAPRGGPPPPPGLVAPSVSPPCPGTFLHIPSVSPALVQQGTPLLVLLSLHVPSLPPWCPQPTTLGCPPLPWHPWLCPPPPPLGVSSHLVLVGAADDVEVKVDAALVDDGQPLEQRDLACGHSLASPPWPARTPPQGWQPPPQGTHTSPSLKHSLSVRWVLLKMFFSKAFCSLTLGYVSS